MRVEKNVSKNTEKLDSSHEILSAKKTLKGKAVDTSDKMLDLVMNTMSNVTKKLAAMDERITGLASKIELTPAKFIERKSRSQEQTKRRGIADSEHCLHHQLIQLQ